MKKLFALLASAALFATAYAATPQVVAHRGFWKTPGSAQNSLRALQLADSIHAYGSEFDLWITADDHIIANHDVTVGDMVVENSTLAQLQSVPLANGEVRPTLEQYLDAAKPMDTRLIIEIKPHQNKQQEAKLVTRTIAEVAKRGLQQRAEYITFSPEALRRLIAEVPAGTPVYYLSGNMSPDELKAVGAAGADYHISAFRKHPTWIDDLHRLGLKVNVWTVDKPGDLIWCIDRGVDFITTNMPTLARTLIVTTPER